LLMSCAEGGLQHLGGAVGMALLSAAPTYGYTLVDGIDVRVNGSGPRSRPLDVRSQCYDSSRSRSHCGWTT